MASGIRFIIYYIHVIAQSIAIYQKKGEHLSIPCLIRQGRRSFEQALVVLWSNIT